MFPRLLCYLRHHRARFSLSLPLKAKKTSIASPISRLPHDIIMETLRYFSTPLHMHEWEAFPWFLGHISSEWRRLFLTMTLEFWSHIKIDSSKFQECPKFFRSWQSRFEELLAFFLECSAGQPFSFLFRCLANGATLAPWDYVKFFCHVFDMIIEHSNRWLNALITIDMPASRGLHHMRNRLPLLRSLELFVYRTDIDPLHEIFTDSPSLLLQKVSTWKFQWSALTSFRLPYMGIFDAHQF